MVRQALRDPVLLALVAAGGALRIVAAAGPPPPRSAPARAHPLPPAPPPRPAPPPGPGRPGRAGGRGFGGLSPGPRGARGLLGGPKRAGAPLCAAQVAVGTLTIAAGALVAWHMAGGAGGLLAGGVAALSPPLVLSAGE